MPSRVRGGCGRLRPRHDLRSLRRGQDGQVTILFALSLVALVGLCGLALDVGLNYLNTSGLQSGADNASLAVARMLAVDYTGQTATPAVSPPWSYSQMVSKVTTVLGSGANQAGASSVTSYSAYFVETTGSSSVTGTTVLCQFAPSGSATCPSMYSASGGLPENSNGVVDANGVKIVPSDNHSTNVMGVIGIHRATETAPATAIFGVIEGVPASALNYAVFNVDCTTNKPLQLYQDIEYYGPSWQQDWGCSAIGDSNFKGDLHSPTPDPVRAPGWISAESGSSTITPVAAGQIIIVPVIDCIAHGSQCTEPDNVPGEPACSATLPSGLATSGQDVMCAVGLIAIKADQACTNGHDCTGEIVPYLPDQTGILICPTSQEPNCGGSTRTQGNPSTLVELYN